MAPHADPLTARRAKHETLRPSFPAPCAIGMLTPWWGKRRLVAMVLFPGRSRVAVMSCVLRASGEHFDVDLFLAAGGLEPERVWRKGEQRLPKNHAAETSGLTFIVSTADFSELEAQSCDALAFLSRNKPFVLGLAAFPGVETVTLDFGAEIHAPFWASFDFAPELLAAMGHLGVRLMLSTYPAPDR